MASIRDLVRDLRGEERFVNPLEQIGFSPAILRLGLSEDQLYDYCQRSARALLAQVHPDRTGKENEEARRFSDALTSLRDRENFRNAMIEFRETHSYQHLEERTLRQQIRALQKHNADLQAAYEGMREEVEKERGFHLWMRRYFAGHSLHTTRHPVLPVSVCRKLTTLSFKLEFVNGPPASQNIVKLQEDYTEAAKRSAGENLLPLDASHCNYIASVYNLCGIQFGELIKRASQSPLALPAIHWDSDLAFREMGMPKMSKRTWASKGGVVRPSGINNDALADEYRECLRFLRNRFGSQYVLRADIFAEELSMRGQLSEAPSGVSKGKRLYVIGTTELSTARLVDPIPKKWDQLIVHEDEFLHEWRSRAAGGGPADLLGCEPILAFGRAVVSLDVAEDARRLSVPDAAHYITRFKRNREGVLQKNKLTFFLAHLVLAAE